MENECNAAPEEKAKLECIRTSNGLATVLVKGELVRSLTEEEREVLRRQARLHNHERDILNRRQDKETQAVVNAFASKGF